jgi:type I restriction enzyme S subunit
MIGSLADSERGSFKIGPFGSSLKKDELVSSGIPVVGIENVLPNRFVTSYRKFITEKKFEQLHQYEILHGDILVTTMGTIGRAAVVPQGIGVAIIDSHLFRMRVDQSKVYPSYLCYGINGYETLQREIRSKSSGAIMAGLNTTILKECSIPLPPLNEQKRIAAILDEQMIAVERARAAAEAQLKAAKDLPTSYLRAVFDSPESKQWQRRQLEEVCSISTGTTPDTNRTDYYKGEIPFIKTSELLDNRISKSEIYVSQQAASDYRLKLYPVGTVLLAMYGQGKTRGRVGLLTISATTTQNAAALVPDASLDSEFLWLWLRSQYKFLRGIGYQGDLSHLSLGFVKQLEIPVPSISKQRSIAAALIKELESSEQLHRKTQEQFDSMEQLPAALLRQAFTGKL